MHDAQAILKYHRRIIKKKDNFYNVYLKNNKRLLYKWLTFNKLFLLNFSNYIV